MTVEDALKDLVFRLADDALIMGHRNSEWTGLGPILEEDIAFSSMAQDELGHSLVFYELLTEMDEAEPDVLAFRRDDLKNFKSCHLVEYPIRDYAFSLVRQFLYDYAKVVRLENLKNSSVEELAVLSKRLLREEKYHILHARTWIEQLGGKGNDDSRARMNKALEEVYPLAFSIFEPTEGNTVLAEEEIMATEQELENRWIELVTDVVENSGLTLPTDFDKTAHYGGRKGDHSPYLETLYGEMTEVVKYDPEAPIW